jgi:hypothetical protein
VNLSPWPRLLSHREAAGGLKNRAYGNAGASNAAFAAHPALMRLEELTALRELG